LNEIADQILASAYDKDYDRACAIGLEAVSGPASGSKEVFAALLELTSRLRSECMDRALQKDDHSDEYHRLESLLRKLNELTGQDIYGKPRPTDAS
jgi:hypothetical protein